MLFIVINQTLKGLTNYIDQRIRVCLIENITNMFFYKEILSIYFQVYQNIGILWAKACVWGLDI